MRHVLERCPQCGGKIQATIGLYVNVTKAVIYTADGNPTRLPSLNLEESQLEVAFGNPEYGPDWRDSLSDCDSDMRVYCENDHNVREFVRSKGATGPLL